MRHCLRNGGFKELQYRFGFHGNKNSGGTDFSPSWHKVVWKNEKLCVTCHKQTVAENNETLSRQNYVDFHNRYNLTFSRVSTM